MSLTDEQIKRMVDRFLGWKLPENFNPDGGVNFKKLHKPNRDVLDENGRVVGARKYPMPSGTNLFDAAQADAMVRYMVEEISPPHPAQSSGGAKEPVTSCGMTVDDVLENLRRYCDGITGKNELGVGVLMCNCAMEEAQEIIVALRSRSASPSPPEPSDAAVEALKKALEPFAKFADPTGAFSDSFKITAGSGMARRQLTMGHCYRAKEALAAYAVDRRAR